MSIDHVFPLEELEAAVMATLNPYLRNPARGMQLLARLTGHPAPESVKQEQREHLDRLHTLIHKDFIDLSTRCSYSSEALAMQQLLVMEESLENFSLFPDLARKHVIGVGGGFSAGKSRFLNTLLGVDLLPESLEPTTAIPSFITRGEADIVALNSFNHRVTLDRDALQAITHAFNDHYRDSLSDGFGFSHILKLLMLHQPHLAWGNIAFLDTPGYSKSDVDGNIHTDQDIALRQLVEADHILWLLSAKNGSIRQDDLGFLRHLKHPQPIFFVITQADLVGEERINAIIDSTRKAIEQAGIPFAGLMAWTAPPSRDHGTRVAGDDVSVWLDKLNEIPKNTLFRSSCQQVLDGYIDYNQESLVSSRRKLALLNTLLPLVDDLPESERVTLQELIREQRQSQVLFKEQFDQFTTLKRDMVEVIGAIAGELETPVVETIESRQHYQDLVDLLSAIAVQKSVSFTPQEELLQQAKASLKYEQNVPDSSISSVTSADEGYADALFSLGNSYENGLGVRRNEYKAISYYKDAANAGHSEAQLKLAKHYLSGEYLKKHSGHAKAWLKKSAIQGNLEAKMLLEDLEYSPLSLFWWDPLKLHR